MKEWDVEQVLSHYCVWAESVAPTCLWVLWSQQCCPRRKGHTLAVCFASSLLFCPWIMFAFAEFCRAFLFCLYAGVHGVGWGRAFSPKESKCCAKGCLDREVNQVSSKGGAGHMWREVGVFLGKEGRMFSQVNKLQNQVSRRHQCLWGQDCQFSLTAVSSWDPCLEITAQGKLSIAGIFPFISFLLLWFSLC